MLMVARDRAVAEGLTNVEFLQADAQVHGFEPGTFDVVISRFGVMFFDDQVAAFTNLARAQPRGGRLALLAWQELAANEWLSTIRGALAMGRDLPAPPAGAPGPFGLADPAYVAKVLDAAGYTDVDLAPVTSPMQLGGDSDAAYAFVSTIGPVVGMLEGLEPDERREALDTLRATLDAHHTGDGVALGSSSWLITACSPDRRQREPYDCASCASASRITAVTSSRISGDAFEGAPESYGGCGSYSIPSWIALATSSPDDLSDERERQVDARRHTRAASRPCPRTRRAPRSAPRRGGEDGRTRSQCVVAGSPSRMPAAPRMSAPVHTDVVYVVVGWAARTQSMTA